MELKKILTYCDTLLKPEKYRDYAPNGLQIEATRDIRRIVTGVTASEALIDAAIKEKADALFVHHGYFWKNDDLTLVGTRYKRIAKLIQNNIALVAYHLPLDDNEKIGNNALFGKALKLTKAKRFGQDHLGWIAASPYKSVTPLEKALAVLLNRQPLVLGPANKKIATIAWCTGAAQDMIEEAAQAGADAYISGEASERTTHLAKELGITYFVCGHHATERFGIKALGEKLARRFKIQSIYIDIDNPL